MLVGRPAYEGGSASDTIAAVLMREPDWASVPPSTPLAVRRLLERSLEHDLKRRQRDIGDARRELELGA
jgi:serine/threonine-protein kinase